MSQCLHRPLYPSQPPPALVVPPLPVHVRAASGIVVTNALCLDFFAAPGNSAGTFEERDFSKWFKDRLKEIVKPTSGPLTFDAGSAELVITGLDEYEGSASIVFLRGAPRRIFDVKFKVSLPPGTQVVRRMLRLHCCVCLGCGGGSNA